MASLFKRPRSPYWWIKYRDPATGRIVRNSTGFRIGVGMDFNRAKALKAELAKAEAESPGGYDHQWIAWVPTYIETRYANSARTLGRVRRNWQFILRYMEERKIFGPQHLTRHQCQDYVSWRRQKNREQGFNGVSHNSALIELRLLSVLMGEAVRRGMVAANCCREIGLKMTTPAPKPEMTDDEIAKIRSEIARLEDLSGMPYHAQIDWKHILRISFEIAVHQGCRISETCVDVLRGVDLNNMTIKFHAKGDKYYETVLHPGLVPLFQELRASGRRMAFEMPKNPTMLSMGWHRFLKRIGLPHLSFHCLRVTVISRLERSGAPEAVVMKLVNHASSTVHRIYRRVSARELSKYWTSGPTPPSSSNPHAPSTTPSHEQSSPDDRNQSADPGASTSGPSNG